MIRYGKLSDAQILAKVIEVCQLEHVSHTDDGLEAIVFTAQGDLRQVCLETRKFYIILASFAFVSKQK